MEQTDTQYVGGLASRTIWEKPQESEDQLFQGIHWSQWLPHLDSYTLCPVAAQCLNLSLLKVRRYSSVLTYHSLSVMTNPLSWSYFLIIIYIQP